MSITQDPSSGSSLGAPGDAPQKSPDNPKLSEGAPPSKIRGAVRKWTDRLLGRDRSGASQASERDPNIYPLF